MEKRIIPVFHQNETFAGIIHQFKWDKPIRIGINKSDILFALCSAIQIADAFGFFAKDNVI